jgi:hypothetical protein
MIFSCRLLRADAGGALVDRWTRAAEEKRGADPSAEKLSGPSVEGKAE